MFENTDLKDFWESKDSISYDSSYVSENLTGEMVKKAEEKLGYKLPKSYIYLMKHQNGGVPKKRWIKGDYTEIIGIYGIGENVENSICGSNGYDFWVSEDRYPDIGIPICDTFTGRT